MEKQKTNVDEVLEKFSIFGRYHLQFMFFAMLAFATNALYSANYIFTVEETGYRCLDDTFANNTCGSVEGVQCTAWEYDNPNSFVAEFQLACQEWKRTLVGTVHGFGYMVGLLFQGPLSDKIGRKKTVIMTGVIGAACGVARSFTHSYWLFIALEFLESVFGDSCSPLFVLSIEIVSAKNRVLYDCLTGFGCVFGEVLLSLAAWSIPYWRNFLRAIYAPSFLFLAYFFLIDESPRWLLTKGENEKAVAILEKMARTNQVKLDRDVLSKLLVEEDSKTVNFVGLLKITFQSRAMLLRCVVCIIWWTTSTFVNYGMMINSVSLEGNKYINYALTTAVDLPGNFIIILIPSKYKRRNPLICSFFAAAILCFAQPFIASAGLSWLSMLLYMISKMMGTLFFTITYIYTSELFPTYTRNSMHAMCSSIGRIGSIIAPQMPLLSAYWSGLPALVFGAASLTAGLVTFLVPDTADDALPDTVREAEDIGKKNKLTMIGIDNLSVVKNL